MSSNSSSDVEVNVMADKDDPSVAPITMNKALIKLKLLNLLKDFNKLEASIKPEDIVKEKLIPFINNILQQVQKSNSFEILETLKLLLHFSIQMNNSSALIKEVINEFIMKPFDEKNKDPHSRLVLDINQQDLQGNTALHIASYLNRFDIVSLLLLDHKDIINDTISNNNNLQALELTNNFKLYSLMVQLRNEYIQEVATELKLAFNNRDFEHLNDILIGNARNQELLDLNGIDPSTGDTVLIEFIKKGDIVMCDWILKVGLADPFTRNDMGKLPKDYINELIQFGLIKSTKVPTNTNSITTNQAIGKELMKMLENATKNQTMINLIQPSIIKNDGGVGQSKTADINNDHFEIVSNKSSTTTNVDSSSLPGSTNSNVPGDKDGSNAITSQEIVEPPIMQGYLKKWTNFATGYKLRYFILNPKEGKLSYYKNKKDLWNCRGSLDLRYCYVYLNCSEGLKFEITTQLNSDNNNGTNSATATKFNDIFEDGDDDDGNADSNNFQGMSYGNNTTTWHLKGNHPVETNKWVWCIQGAIRYCKDRDISLVHSSKRGSTISLGPKDMGSGLNNNSSKSTMNMGGKNGITKNRNASIIGSNMLASDNRKLSSTLGLPDEKFLGMNQTTQRIKKKSIIELPSFRKKLGNELNENNFDNVTLSSISSDSDDTASEYDDVSIVEEEEETEELENSHNKQSGKAMENSKADETLTKDKHDRKKAEEYDSSSHFKQDIISGRADEFNDETLLKIQRHWTQLNSTVNLELNNLIDLLQNMDSSESNDTILETLNSILYSHKRMNRHHYKMISRNEKIVSKLNKVLALWIQSVKDLEFELIAKDDKIEKLQKDLKLLKKSQQINSSSSNTNINTTNIGNAANKEIINKNTGKKNVDSVSGKLINESTRDHVLEGEEQQKEREFVGVEKNINNNISPNEEKKNNEQEQNFVNINNNNTDLDNINENSIISSSDDDEFFDFDDFNDDDGGLENIGNTNSSNNFVTNKESAAIVESANIDNSVSADKDIDKTAEATKEQELERENNNLEQDSNKNNMVVTAKDADLLNVNPELKDKVRRLVEAYNKKTTDPSGKIHEEFIDLYNDPELKRYLEILEQNSFNGYQDGPRKRLKLSADERPKVSLWSVLKSMIGKDMTKMSLPVSFNEPTNLLQRVVEDMEYVEILDKASTFYQLSTLRMLYVAIFSVSPYASTQGRVAKPFNPLLGETFEFVEPWKNYRCITEQVSHHPPIGAIYMDSPSWEYYGESNVDSSFNGRCFDFKHLGTWFINLKYGLNNEEELYSFRKPNNQVIGILTGNPQVDNYGEMVIYNNKTGDKCVIHFKARGWRSNHAYELKGEVFNKKGEKEWMFGGHWNSEIYAKKCTNSSETSSKKKEEEEDMIKNSANIKKTEVKFDGSKFLVWKANKRPSSPFNLTQFAIQLNALPDNLKPCLPRTDTRLRPDQKCMEDGLYDKASTEKHRVEEKQRASRKKRLAENVKWEPVWFKKDKHPVTNEDFWRYKGGYWESRQTGEWTKDIPDIF